MTSPSGVTRFCNAVTTSSSLRSASGSLRARGRSRDHQCDRGESAELGDPQPAVPEKLSSAPNLRASEKEDDQRLKDEREPNGDRRDDQPTRDPDPAERSVRRAAEQPPLLVEPAGAQGQLQVGVPGMWSEIEYRRLGDVEAEERCERRSKTDQSGFPNGSVAGSCKERHEHPGCARVPQGITHSRLLSLDHGDERAENDAGEQEWNEFPSSVHCCSGLTASRRLRPRTATAPFA